MTENTRDEYNPHLVILLLENYELIEQYKLPANPTSYTDWGTVISHSRLNRAPFEMAVIFKADIDRALARYRIKRENLAYISPRMIKRITNFLNGVYMPRWNGKQDLSKSQINERIGRKKRARR